MCRLMQCVLAMSLSVAACGCCAGPWRFYQNAYGWNCPDTERYCPGPPPPDTTPPGYSKPVVPEQVIANTGRTSPGVPVPRDAAPPTDVLPEESPLPESDSGGDKPASLRSAVVMPAAFDAPVRLPPINELPEDAIEVEEAETDSGQTIPD